MASTYSDIASNEVEEGSVEARMYEGRMRLYKRQTDNVFPRYARNQRESPLLRLPAEIRLKIYELVLGTGNTIFITMKNFNSKPDENKRYSFIWGCRVVDPSINPFKDWGFEPPQDASHSLTLLNGVCRQLYKESTNLSFSLNSWVADEGNYNFDQWVYERLPSSQRRAIHTLVTTSYILPESILKYLGGVKWLIKQGCQSERYGNIGDERWHKYEVAIGRKGAIEMNELQIAPLQDYLELVN